MEGGASVTDLEASPKSNGVSEQQLSCGACPQGGESLPSPWDSLVPKSLARAHTPSCRGAHVVPGG